MTNASNQAARSILLYPFIAVLLSALYCFALCTASAAQTDSGLPPSIVVHPQFGGQILGFGIDQGGTEGLLSEYVSEGGGENLVATEAFDQATGNIIAVLAMRDHTFDDYATEGVVGNHVGLVLYQNVVGGVVHNYYFTENPVNTNHFTGLWTPPMRTNYQLMGLVPNEGQPRSAFLMSSVLEQPYIFLFTSNVVQNTFSPLVPYNNGNIGCCPAFAYDSKLNDAFLAGDNGSPTSVPILATINLTTGAIHEVNGAGVGNPNGAAIDSLTDTVAITTPGGPFTFPMVQFFNLNTQSGNSIIPPGNNVGGDVEFDSLHRLFIVAASDGFNNSILEYDVNGNLRQQITGGPLNNLLTCCTLNPSTRTGFGLGRELLTIVSFSY